MNLLAQAAQPLETPRPLFALQTIYTTVISLAIGAAGVLFFILFVIGGFSYLTAGGDERKVEGARKILTYAIMGLVLIALSYLILVFIQNFTGVDVTHFSITQ